MFKSFAVINEWTTLAKNQYIYVGVVQEKESLHDCELCAGIFKQSIGARKETSRKRAFIPDRQATLAG